jgi:hypothetical protein
MKRFAWALALLASCGGDDGGLSPDDPLAGLSDDEVGDLCADLVETYEEDVDFTGLCTFAVLLLSASQSEPLEPEECTLGVLFCATQLRSQLLDAKACTDNLSGRLEDCDATVGEMMECIDFTIEAAGSALAGLTCAAAGDPKALASQLADIEANLAEPPAGCAALFSCSGLELLSL